MVFKSLLRDNVTLIKQSGTTVKSIKASVQPKKIFIEGRKPLIETGDLVQTRSKRDRSSHWTLPS